ncbi:MAG: site-specific integrase, partial [Phycisphaerae bacterium]
MFAAQRRNGSPKRADADRSPAHAIAEPDFKALVRRFLDHLVAECGLANNTVLAYRRDLAAFVSILNHRGVERPSDVSPLDVQSFLIALNDRGYELSSIARHLSTVRMFLRFLHMIGRMPDDLTTQMEAPQRWHKLPRTLNLPQVEALMDAPPPNDPYALRDRAILEMLYGTGMRVSEAAGLLLGDVNRTVGYVRCLGKGGRERIC